jgi:type VI secretion system secreted protein Hcp
MSQVDYFLKIDGIPGESLDRTHKDAIDVLSWSWGVQHTGTMAYGGGGGEGRASFHDFNFTHYIDKSSPVLMKACATGEHIKEATIHARKTGEGQNDFLKVTFTDVLVSSFREGGDLDGVIDNTSLRYKTVAEQFGEPITIDIDARAAGTAQLDVRTGAIEILPCPEGQCILIAGFYQQFLARGLAEFEIKDFLPLINPPLSNGRLTFQCIPLQQPPTDVIGVPALAVDSSLTDLRGETGAGQFDVLVYQPADLEIAPDDYRGRAKRIGTLAVGPGVPAEPLTVDLSDMVGTGDGTLGIRIQLHGADELMEEEGATQTPPNPVVARFMVVLTFDSN